MLSKNEKLVMALVYDLCYQGGSCLISAEEIKARLNNNKFTTPKIDALLKSLELDGFFDLVQCFKGGESLYCINMRPKGYAFLRDFEKQRRVIFNKIMLAIVSALVTFLVGRLLFYLF